VAAREGIFVKKRRHLAHQRNASTRRGIIALAAAVTACTVDAPPAEQPVIHVRFDPDESAIPTPTDILRNEETGLLEIPAEPEDLADKSAAEAEVIHALNRRDAWPTHTSATFELTGAIDPKSIDDESIRIFEVTDEGFRPVEIEVEGTPTTAPTEIEIPPPEGGWKRGTSYVGVALGGPDGLVGENGELVVGDAAFWFLRLKASLLDHVDAIPGDDAAERQENAESLEEIRVDLAPHFEELEKRGIPRKHVASLWSWSVSTSPEVLMDKETSKMPLPSDFLRDPVTGRVDLPIDEDESHFRQVNKASLNELDGFGLSAGLMFETTAPIHMGTITSTTMFVFAVGEGEEPELTQVELSFDSRAGRRTIVATPVKPLRPDTDHVLVATTAIQDDQGNPLAAMTPGILAMLDESVFVDGASTIESLDGESAARIEPMRKIVSRVLAVLAKDGLQRESVAAAWSFHTMKIVEPLLQARDAAKRVNSPKNPVDVSDKSSVQAVLDFPISGLDLIGTRRVYQGFIETPDFLDPITNKMRDDGGFELRRIPFTMTVPRRADRDEPLKVVIFGHALMADHKFVMSVADSLGRHGIAAISIDFPYHGQRSHCTWKGPQCLVNPLDQTGDLICPNPCNRGDMCAADGQCVDNAGDVTELNKWPLVGFPQSSGGAFVDVENLAGTRDHFYQAVTDLGALKRSLEEGDWESVLGQPIDPEIGYAGQSLGGVIGSLYAAANPDVDRVVLNVPGGDLVELFRQSTIFKPHIDATLLREEIEPGSYEHEQFLNVARWIADAIDPQNFARNLIAENIETGRPMMERKVLIQLATLDIVIPNEQTRWLAELSGVPIVDYIAEHAFIIVPIEPAYFRGTRDLARVLGEGELP